MENIIVKPKKMMKISELFSLSFKIYDNKFWSLMGLVVFPGLTFLVLFVFFVLLTDLLPNGAILTSPVIILFSILAATMFLACILVNILSKIALFLVIKENPDKFSIIAMLKKSKPYFGSYLWLIFLSGILVALWTMLFIIPGIIFMIYYSLSIWVFLDLGLKGKEALNKSKELIKGYWWAVFGKFMIPFISMFIIIIPSSFVEPKSQAANAYSFVISIFSILVTPFFTAYIFNIYKNLKEIKA